MTAPPRIEPARGHGESDLGKLTDPGLQNVPAWTATRVARPARDLAQSTRFYRDLLGLPVIGGFENHDGYDGVFFGLPGGGELELTAGPEQPVPSTDEDLLVLYVQTFGEVEAVSARLVAAGITRIPSANPYWNRMGQTFVDPDGYRLVVATTWLDSPIPKGGAAFGSGALAAIPTDADLYLRGCETLLATWEEYARGAVGAIVKRFPGVAVAVFPNEPERSVYNNALFERDLEMSERTEALDAMEAAYGTAGVTGFAAWVHESDEAMCGDLKRRGYTLDTTTRAMGLALGEIRLSRPEIDLGPAAWDEYLRSQGLAADFLSGANHASLHVLVARIDEEVVAAALAYDFDGDCGIYNVETVEWARRRGLGTALTAAHLYDALARGCQTASLQSTPIAERVYSAAGFRDLGRILEYVQ